MTTKNNGLPVRIYQKQFAELMAKIYGVQAAFLPTFGSIQTLDGISNSATAFSVKTNDLPVVTNEYATGANVAFGTGTASTSRFGELKEVIYTDTDVPYSFSYAFNEGIDIHTVNIDADSAVADRLELQAQALLRKFNVAAGTYLATGATDLGSLADINAIFEEAVVKYTDLEVLAHVTAYVNAEMYNAIINLPSVSSAKGSSVNIDENGILSFRGMTVSKLPSQYLGGKPVIFAPDNIGKAFTGIATARAIPSENFDGYAVQGAGKGGHFVPDDNKAAVFTATVKTVSGS